MMNCYVYRLNKGQPWNFWRFSSVISAYRSCNLEIFPSIYSLSPGCYILLKWNCAHMWNLLISCLPCIWNNWNIHKTLLNLFNVDMLSKAPKLPLHYAYSLPLILLTAWKFQIWGLDFFNFEFCNCRLKSDGLVWYFWHCQSGGRRGIWGGVICCWGSNLLT